MALTATANLTTRTIVIESLDMRGCHVISRLPNKPNVSYSGDKIRQPLGCLGTTHRRLVQKENEV